MDCILTYHTSPLTCGVAKFNYELARRLGVPCASWFDHTRYRHPLLSLKWSEISERERAMFLFAPPEPGSFDLLWHDDDGPPKLTRSASKVYAANCVIAKHLRGHRPDIVEVWCPSTVCGGPTRGDLSILSFGMAQKFSEMLFHKLRALLDRSRDAADYTIAFSTGIHEGSLWDETFAHSRRMLGGIFDGRARWLGFLADDALIRELQEADVVALFYHPAARANNTTLWAALEAAKPVITNLDGASPTGLEHGVNVFDIERLSVWPSSDEQRLVARNGRAVVGRYGWDGVIDAFRQHSGLGPDPLRPGSAVSVRV
jgi:hypothetical protein